MLGIGATVKRPVVVNDPELGEVIAVRDMVYLALSYDHRLVDGADAARYLARSRRAWRPASSRPSSACPDPRRLPKGHPGPVRPGRLVVLSGYVVQPGS